MTSYSVAFLSPDPVMMYLSSDEISLHSTDDDSFDYTVTRQTKYMSVNESHQSDMIQLVAARR